MRMQARLLLSQLSFSLLKKPMICGTGELVEDEEVVDGLWDMRR